MKKSPLFKILVTSFALLAGLTASSQAVTYTWGGSATGLWNTGANWVGGTAPVSGNGNQVEFGTSGSVDVDYNTSRTLGSVNLLAAATGTTTINLAGATRVFTLQQLVSVGEVNLAAASGNLTFAGSGNVSIGSTNYNFNNNSSSGTLTFSSIIAGIAGRGITLTGTGKTIFSGANTYLGTTTINAGTLQLDNSGAGNSTASIAVNNAGSVLAVKYGGGSDYNEAQVGTLLGKTTFGATTTAFAFDTTNGSGTYATALTMAAGLKKLGTNSLALTAANTYTGGTTVSVGTLLVNNASGSGTGTGAVSVASGATLGGNGTISGATTISAGGTLAPGNSPGVLSFGSTLTLAGNATMEINGLVRGTDFDGINTTGLLTYGGALSLNFGAATGIGNTYDLFQIGAGSYTGSFASVSLGGLYSGNLTNSSGVWSGTNGGFTFTFTQSTGDLGITAVPEPATWALLAFSLTTVMVFRRRRA